MAGIGPARSGVRIFGPFFRSGPTIPAEDSSVKSSIEPLTSYFTYQKYNTASESFCNKFEWKFQNKTISNFHIVYWQ